MKDTSQMVLKPYELHLGHGNVISMEGVYATSIGHDN